MTQCSTSRCCLLFLQSHKALKAQEQQAQVILHKQPCCLLSNTSCVTGQSTVHRHAVCLATSGVCLVLVKVYIWAVTGKDWMCCIYAPPLFVHCQPCHNTHTTISVVYSRSTVFPWINTMAFIVLNTLDNTGFVWGRPLFEGGVYYIRRMLLRTWGSLLIIDIAARRYNVLTISIRHCII